MTPRLWISQTGNVIPTEQMNVQPAPVSRSRSTLPNLLPIPALKLCGECPRHPFADALTEGDLSDVLVGEVESAGYIRNYASHAPRPLEFGETQCKIHGGNQLSGSSGKTLYADLHAVSTVNMQISIDPRNKVAVGRAFQVARLETGLSQRALGIALGIEPDRAQYTVSRWESGSTSTLPIEAIRALGRLISPASRNELFEVTGVKNERADLLTIEVPTRSIGVLNSTQDLGDPMAVAAFSLPLPSEWLPQDANVRAAKLDSRIYPIFGEELIALVDIRHRDPERLVGCVVMVRTQEDGNVPMMLQRHGKTFLLVPIGDGSDRIPRVMQDEGDWSIVGQVIRWVGSAPSPSGPREIK